MSSAPGPRVYPRDTRWEPGEAAWSSLRHAWGTLATARTRLEQSPPNASPDQLAEWDAALEAAQHLIDGCGEAIRRSLPPR